MPPTPPVSHFGRYGGYKLTFSRVPSGSGELGPRMDTQLGSNASRNRICRSTMIFARRRNQNGRLGSHGALSGSVAQWDANTNRVRTPDDCNRI
jgi:hypothetical protein